MTAPAIQQIDQAQAISSRRLRSDVLDEIEAFMARGR
jgi:hypothetical protein